MTTKLFAAFTLALAFLAIDAQAACSNPTANEGVTLYNYDYHTPQYCNGTNWLAIGGVYTVPWVTNGTSVYYTGGNVGVGLSTPQVPLDLATNTSGYGLRIRQSTGNANLAFLQFTDYAVTKEIGGITADNSGNVSFRSGTAGTTAMYLTSAGYVGIGTAAPSQKLHVVGNIVAQSQFYDLLSNPQGGAALCRNGSTGLHSECSSDRRLKKNIVYLHAPTLHKLMQLRPATFNWRKGDPARQIGFIAQDVKAIFPLAVGGDEHKQMLTFTPGNLVPYIVKALQEMAGQSDDIRAEFARLKADNDNLRADFEAYKKAHP